MKIDPDDRLRLQHMLDYAREVIEFTKDVESTDLDTNLILHRAVTMTVGIIGEAATHISDAFKTEHPEIPWPNIIGMRNHLFHAYYRIDTGILWKTATASIPELIPLLEAILND